MSPAEMPTASPQICALAQQVTQQLVRIDTTVSTAGQIEGLRAVAARFAGRSDLEVILPEGRDGVPTCLLVLPRADRSELLLLSGHIDTVPANPQGWRRDPWSGEISEGVLHGRGASDMKSGLGAQIATLLASPAGAPVGLAVSLNEENGCQGTDDVILALQQAGARPEALIVGEPTNGQIVLGHKGPLWIEVVTTGVAAHGSTPDRGVNAIEKMARLLLRARAELPLRSHPQLGTESLNIGVIKGGTLRNMVPDRCLLEIDMRTADPDPEPLLAWWRDQPETAELTIIVQQAALWTEPDEPWVRSLPGEFAAGPVGFGTEAGPLSAAFGLSRAIVWGPGPMDAMHALDEQVSLAAIDQATAGYCAAVRSWLERR